MLNRWCGKIKTLVRHDRSEFIQARGARVEKAAALGYGAHLFEETRWLKPKVVRPRGASADAQGNAPCSKAAEGRNIQADVAKLMHGVPATCESLIV